MAGTDIKLKINIVNYEMGRFNGILSKFAIKLNEELIKLGHDSYITATPEGKSDIRHHINYLPYKYDPIYKGIDTLMITHIWKGYKLNALTEGMQTAFGICMSGDTKKYLGRQQISAKKLFTILPAHDGLVRRHQVVAILTNIYPDGCKREEMFTKLAETLDYNKWAFRIMGSGWKDILVPLVAKGLQVDYFAEFDYDTHKRILETSDYSLYFGEDEGSMGLLDAKNASLKLIAPNVGFNKDIGIDYPFHIQKQLNDIFKKLSVNPVESWLWSKYASEHLKIWKKLLD
jgi:hypothetical protein